MTLACLCLLISCGQSAQSKIHTLVRDIQNARAEAGASQEKYIWRIYHLSENALDHKKWDDARRALIAQGAQVDDSSGSELVDIEIPGAEFTTSSGLKHELVIRLGNSPIVSDKGLSEIRITFVWPHLDANPNKKFSDFVEAKPYPPKSVLAAVLGTDGVSSLAKKYPKVVEMRLSYEADGPAISEEVAPGEHWPYVFNGDITLENERGDGVTLTYLSNSGFDPEHDINWKPVSQGFVYRETAGPLRSRFEGIPDNHITSSYSKSNSDDYLAISRVSKDDVSYQSPTKAYSAGDLRLLPVGTKRLMLDGLEFKDHDYKLLSRFVNLRELDIATPENPNGPDPRDLTVL